MTVHDAGLAVPYRTRPYVTCQGTTDAEPAAGRLANGRTGGMVTWSNQLQSVITTIRMWDLAEVNHHYSDDGLILIWT